MVWSMIVVLGSYLVCCAAGLYWVWWYLEDRERK